MSTRIVFLIVVLLAMDTYVFKGLKSIFSKSNFHLFILITYVLGVFLMYVGLFSMINTFKLRPVQMSLYQNLLIGFAFSFFLFKLLLTAFLILDDFIRIVMYLFESFSKIFFKATTEVVLSERRDFLIKLGLGVASIPFASMLYGITKGKYNYKVQNLRLQFSNLPKAFEGFRIVHISDIHAGSFDSLEQVKRGVDLINAQNPDVVCFTGDLVNNDAREIEPYIDVFKGLQSKQGVYSVLGNHDYGDYKNWPSKKAKQENLKLLESLQEQMNFRLLKNEHIRLHKDSDEIAVLGVENWGKPPFVAHGDLDKTLVGVEEKSFKILLSHDPSHWDEKVLPHQTNIDLTLSGHTHGMQFGIDIPGFRWSPVKYKYPRWAGLYQEAKKFLYVNKGFGFLGFPGRVGIWPEITVIELENSKQATRY